MEKIVVFDLFRQIIVFGRDAFRGVKVCDNERRMRLQKFGDGVVNGCKILCFSIYYITLM